MHTAGCVTGVEKISLARYAAEQNRHAQLSVMAILQE